MKTALKELAPVFTSNRMVRDYVHSSYLPAQAKYMKLAVDGYRPARELSAWRMEMMTHWNSVQITGVQTVDLRGSEEPLLVGDGIKVTANVHLGEIPVEHICVEAYAGPVNQAGDFANRQLTAMHPEGSPSNGWQAYSAGISPDQAGRFGFTVRATPVHPLLPDPYSLGLTCWARQ
jgi:starch phosphorylase